MQFRGRLPDAEIEYRAALKLDATLWRAHNSLGNLFFVKKQYAEALRSYQEALRQKPSEVLHYNIGVAHYQRNDFGSAATAFEAAVQANSSFGEAYLALAKTLHAMGRDDDARSVQQRMETQQATLGDRIDPPLTLPPATVAVASEDQAAAEVADAKTTTTQTASNTTASEGGAAPPTLIVLPPYHASTDTVDIEELPGVKLPGFSLPGQLREAAATTTSGPPAHSVPDTVTQTHTDTFK